nr:MAG TPA: PORTAL PROTEIN [Caudoviricetes sp.]
MEFLKGRRFDENANRQFMMTIEDFETIEFESQKWIARLKNFVGTHRAEQLDRLKELKRYYLADNNIKYRDEKSDKYSADNRIASDWAKYITVFEQGYMLGNPVEYKNENAEIQALIDNFSKQNNEQDHNVAIKTDLAIYGRAYELLNTFKDEDESVWVKLYRMNPEQTFVIYDDSYEQRSLMAVNYYSISYGNGHKRDFVKVYTDDSIYEYVDDNQEADTLRLKEKSEHFFNGVPVNEFSNNTDRTGAFEAVLDSIDAYDLSQSELANFQQDSNEALLVISGNPFTGVDDKDFLEDGRINPNGRLAVSQSFKKAKILVLDDNPIPGGSSPSAHYLVKTYDTAGAEAYKERLVNDILRFTFTPDTTDSNFAGTQSGEAMKYKMMAADNYRGKQELLFEKGLMRRLRLAVNIWKIKGNDSDNYNLINETDIVFTPNLPQNNNEMVAIVKNLYGVVSEQTIVEILERVTGVNAETELKRLKEDTEKALEMLPRITQENEVADEQTEESNKS